MISIYIYIYNMEMIGSARYSTLQESVLICVSTAGDAHLIYIYIYIYTYIYIYIYIQVYVLISYINK